MSVKPRQKAASKPCGVCAYIGPTIRGLIQTGTLYAGSKEDTVVSVLKDAVKQYPEIEDLVVPGIILTDSRNKLKIPGSALSVKFKALERRVKEEHLW